MNNFNMMLIKCDVLDMESTNEEYYDKPQLKDQRSPLKCQTYYFVILPDNSILD